MPTSSEEILQRLGRKAFLTAWSYSNPFRDQKQGGVGDGKELCDLLVVFMDHILIFSDKHISFPESGDIELDWMRWYRRAVSESYKQILGAQRWIKEFPDRVFNDSSCNESLSLIFPENPRIHRVIVVRGASAKSLEYNGLESLALTNQQYCDNARPFILSQPGDEFCHIFDEKALDRVLDYLDTASDFINYIMKKEELFGSAGVVEVASEEDLLASYLLSLDASNERNLPHVSKGTILRVQGGQWDEFQASKQYQAWVAANEISYGIDFIIERFIAHHLGENTFIPPWDPGYQAISQSEMRMLLTFLARTSRFYRRILSDKISQCLQDTAGLVNMRRSSVSLPMVNGEPAYAILVLSRLDYVKTEDEFRAERQRILECLVLVVKYLFPQMNDVVGLGISVGENGQSEDIVYLDCRDWSPEKEERARYLHETKGLLAHVTHDRGSRWEFPVDDFF